MLRIRIKQPIKTPQRYEFRCRLSGDVPLSRKFVLRSKALIRRRAWDHRFGFIANNFKIQHAEIWDTVYPLIHLGRDGGPVFGRFDKAVLRFDYPVLESALDFLLERAAIQGMELKIEAETSANPVQLSTSGAVQSFGGGKESRALLGILRETGVNPTLLASVTARSQDLPETLTTTPLMGWQGALTDRIMPALMLCPQTYFHGSALGGSHFEMPWQQNYDWSAPPALSEFANFMQSLGVELDAQAPLSVLPYNIVQRILGERYPALCEHQVSVYPGELSDKTLHVALCKRYHGQDFSRECNLAQLQALLDTFVEQHLENPQAYGYRNHAVVIVQEMKAMLHACRDKPELAAVRERIPAEWAGAWIDRIHRYVAPDVAAPIMAILEQYGADMSEAEARASGLKLRVNSPGVLSTV